MEEKKLEQDKVLEVKNLRISFKTNGGTVKAVRGINFSLYKGRTLAIVGESGSGKSVTSKAILGILANNKIIEDGQIIFEGKDLLKLNEDQFTKIRGVKISMIFQDPLSSLNPIMKVGKQLTEAMILKSKATRKEARKFVARFDKYLKETSKETFESFKNELKKHDEVTSKEEKEQIINDLMLNTEYINLFIDAIKKQKAKQDEHLTTSIELANDFYSSNFSDIKECDIKKISSSVKPLLSSLKHSLFALALDADDIIEVYPIQMKDYINSIEISFQKEKKREELFAKYNVNDVYDLPPNVRAKLTEVILSKESLFLEMEKVTSTLINHLNIVLSLKNDSYFIDLAKESYHKYLLQYFESKAKITRADAKKEALRLLKEVGIPEPERRYEQYPFEFSGGMRQRIVIAIALSSNPEILICDEPTTALDVTIQSQILELIQKLKIEKNLSIIFITHDLGVVANMADDIAVMYAGKIVEYGTVYDIFYDPRHPYTWALLGSMPDLTTKEKLNAIPGTPPNMLLPPKGDAFALRNDKGNIST